MGEKRSAESFSIFWQLDIDLDEMQELLKGIKDVEFAEIAGRDNGQMTVAQLQKHLYQVDMDLVELLFESMDVTGTNFVSEQEWNSFVKHIPGNHAVEASTVNRWALVQEYIPLKV